MLEKHGNSQQLLEHFKRVMVIDIVQRRYNHRPTNSKNIYIFIYIMLHNICEAIVKIYAKIISWEGHSIRLFVHHMRWRTICLGAIYFRGMN